MLLVVGILLALKCVVMTYICRPCRSIKARYFGESRPMRVLHTLPGEKLVVQEVPVGGVCLGEHVHVRGLVEDRHLEPGDHSGDHRVVGSHLDLTPPTPIMNILWGQSIIFHEGGLVG